MVINPSPIRCLSTLAGNPLIKRDDAVGPDDFLPPGHGKFDPKQPAKDDKEKTQAEKLVDEEKARQKSLKKFYAFATVMDTTVRGFATLGNVWGIIDGISAGSLSGWTAVWAGMGSAITVTDNAWQVKSAAVYRNAPACVDGSLGIVQGIGVLACAMGLGRIPALVSLGAGAGRIAYQVYRAYKDAQERKAAKDEIKEEQKKKQAGQQPPANPAPAPAPAPTPAPAPAPAPSPAQPPKTASVLGMGSLAMAQSLL